MAKKVLVTGKAPGALGPYSQGVQAGALVFCSGQVGLTPDGKPAGAGVPEQADQCLRNLAAVLAAAGLTMDAVVKTTVFMTDLGQFAAMNEVYARHFRAPYPARSTVQVSALPKGAAVEIEAVAVRP